MRILVGNWRDKNERTFLSRACSNDDLETARQCFKDRPEDLNQPDNYGNTPLHIAALEGFVDIVQFLLQSGAEVDTRNIYQETPLMNAVEFAHIKVAKLLLEYGANPWLENQHAQKVEELAQNDVTHKVIRELIVDAQAQGLARRRKPSPVKVEEHLTETSEDHGLVEAGEEHNLPTLPTFFPEYGHNEPYEQIDKYGRVSLTSKQIDPNIPLCPTELAGKFCQDLRCEEQHFRHLALSGKLLYLNTYRNP